MADAGKPLDAELQLMLIQAALERGVDVVGRRIFLHGDVGEDTIALAVRGLYLLSDASQDPIGLYVTSYGGDLDEAFALHDVTRTIKAPVHTVALGKCQSAAPLLVACGQPGQRLASENTRFMLHDASIEFSGAETPLNAASHAEVTRLMMERYAQLLAKYTKKDRRHWRRLFASKSDTFFDAWQAEAWGLVDAVWSEKP